MNFDDERFVKIYPRNTTNWKLLGWEGRCVLLMLLREVDRAGCLDIDGGMEGLALLLDLPPDVTERGFVACVKRGSVVHNGNTATIPNFVRAQDARQTDRVRQAESRARRREHGMSQNVTETAEPVTDRDKTSHAVTRCHAMSHDVTLRLDQTRPEQTKTSCAASTHGQPALPLVPQQAAESEPDKPQGPEAPKPASKSQVIAQTALVLFGELQAARKRCNPGTRKVTEVLPGHTREIERCLRDGLTADQVRHVIAVWEELVKAGKREGEHFGSVSPFRAGNVMAYVEMSIADAKKPRTATQGFRPQEPVKPQPDDSELARQLRALRKPKEIQ